MPNTQIQLRRYRSHWRAGLVLMLGGNVALALGIAGVDLVLPESTPLPVRVVLIGATMVLVIVAVLQRIRKLLSAEVASIEVSPTHLVLTRGRGASRSVAVAQLTLQRLAYLRHECGAVDHVPVLELRPPGGPTLRVVGPGARAWPQFDAETDNPPRYVVDASDWDTLCEHLVPGGGPR